MSDEMEKIFKKCNGVGEVRLAAKAHEREVGEPPLVVDEDAHEELGQQLLMQQEGNDFDEELLLSMLVQDDPHDNEEEEQRAKEELMEEFEVGMTKWDDEKEEDVVLGVSSSA